ncbi:DUF2171 domain-containing protein [Kribbella sp. NPDC026596]|uniref:DUF2171 domain-containing protein n=1 Tax=Kribbella sp. NPDC026596 TaxID=3155122 RepID=UPI0033D205AD
MDRRTSAQTALLMWDAWIGMSVIDANGKLVGTVKDVDTSLLTVAGAGLMDNDCYVRAEQIAATDEDQVFLSVSAADLSIDYGRWI